ncbi:MAG: phage terminase small subunit-related protein [Promethearchaeota archaeon]
MANYSKSLINKARLIYRECGNIVKTADSIGVSKSTIHAWKQKYNWEKKSELEKQEELQKTPSEVSATYDKQLQNISEETNLNKSDIEVLKQVKYIENICIETINCKNLNKMKEKYALYPMTFDLAVRALEKCWNQRYQIFNKDKNMGGSDVKINILKSVQQYFGGKDGSSQEEGTDLVRQRSGNFELSEY